MLFSESSAFGLDLSDLSIKIACLKKTGASLGLVSFGREEIPEKTIEDGVIKNEDELINTIKKAVSQVKGKKISTQNCIVSLPETEAYVRMVQLPRLKKEEIGEAIRWEIEANIPVAVDDIYYDWQLIGEETGASGHLEILIGALPKVLVDPYLDVIKKSGFNPVVFEIESIALARALVQEGNDESVMVVDIGAKRTNLIICAHQAVWFTNSLPVSNRVLTAEIAKKFNISLEEALRLKLDIGLDFTKDEGRVLSAIEPKLMEMVGEINRYLDYYKSSIQGHQGVDVSIKKILLCGGGANLAGLSSFLSARLKLEAMIGNPWVNIVRPGCKTLPQIPFNESLSFATALGLALRGVKYF